MLYRLFMFGMLLALLFRLIRGLLGTVLRYLFQYNAADANGQTQKKTSIDLDETQIRDAEFRDLEN